MRAQRKFAVWNAVIIEPLLHSRGASSEGFKLPKLNPDPSSGSRSCCVRLLDDRPRMRWAHGEKAGLGGPPSSAMKLARASVGEGAKDGAGVPVHDLTKVHGDREQEDQEEEVDAKE